MLHQETLEADIQHVNSLLAGIPDPASGKGFQLKLVHSNLTPLILVLFQWLDWSCTCLLPLYLDLFHILIYEIYPDGKPNMSTQVRKATVREFYAVILASVRQIHDNLVENKYRKKKNGNRSERDEECGICLEACTKMVLPNCCHALCINCYRDWNLKSESCPFCRGGLKRVKSEDLWVLTGSSEVVDLDTVKREDLLQFYQYIQSLPKDTTDALFLVYYEYLI